MPRAHAEPGGFPLGRPLANPDLPARLWPRRLLVVVLAATTLGGFGLIALSQGTGAPESPPPALASRLVENRTMAELAAMPGFQRRGNNVVGEVCTRDGQALRLVLDARNQTLIGFRLLPGGNEPAPGGRTGCAPGKALPIAQTPAN